MKKAQLSHDIHRLPLQQPFVSPYTLTQETGTVIDFRIGANENLIGSSTKVSQAIITVINDVHLYADPKCHNLTESLARFYQLPNDSIWLSSGIDELLGLVIRLFSSVGDVVISTRETYPTLSCHVNQLGRRNVFVDYNKDLQVNIPDLLASAKTYQASIIYLANPDNPTGSFQPLDLKELSSLLPDKCLLLLDEAYIEFTGEEQSNTIDGCYENIIQVRTFSKFYALAGLRIGYAIAHPIWRKAFEKIRLQYGVNICAQVGAIAALNDYAHQRRVHAETNQVLVKYKKFFKMLGLEVLNSSTNFLMVGYPSSKEAKWYYNQFLNKGIFTRIAGKYKPLNRFLRFTACRKDQLTQLLNLLKIVCKTSLASKPTTRSLEYV